MVHEGGEEIMWLGGWGLFWKKLKARRCGKKILNVWAT